MNKFFALIAALILLPLTANAIEYKEGTHYEIVKQTATATPEVMEFFSFYCPHCLQFEPLMNTLKDHLPKNVKIKKNHVDFLGREMGPEITKAFAASQLLQVEDKVTDIIFDQIQKQRKAITSEKDILAIFKTAGISEKEAKGALESFPVNGLASQMKRNTETFRISGVPTIIVNGKYKVNTGSISSTAEFIDLVDFLTQKKD
ncbi:thiol:disulfide interchange protein DsbA/DsbL [Psychromonas antarctica]|jgi:thiol:disulfide interchange protein DsbA|uniref:thiol:disulfide interchange protein DsbA/DsbL n=1 Tax=Psychromonas antarctica TaxID=67573 RepID=UPI001EE89774|nr:thiol:disulfide interchange protein DsbA/DsbL [Psychromonas antarctica]MCG6200728.1 thiol:disulfide interchange protein DsbA/DsbL [Psychromonas antarctica]